MSRDLSMCSRFDFNVYSYESEWTIGAEWWTRRRAKPAMAEPPKVESVLDETPVLPDIASPELPPILPPLPPPPPPPSEKPALEDINGVVKAKMSTSTVRLPAIHEQLVNLRLMTFVCTVVSVGGVIDVGGPCAELAC